MTKIMLVEDDNNLREIYEARLLAEGYEIVSAKDGEEALAMAVKEKPDLIISDIMMPKISGFDMLDILRSTPETKNTKVIMMTALSQTEDKARADKLGADRYLVKSQVTLEDVAKVAREVLSGEEGSQSAGTTTPTPPPTDAPVAPTTPAAPTVATPPADSPASKPSDDSVSSDSSKPAPSDSPQPAQPSPPATSTGSTQIDPALAATLQEEEAAVGEQINQFASAETKTEPTDPGKATSTIQIDVKNELEDPNQPLESADPTKPAATSSPDSKLASAVDEIVKNDEPKAPEPQAEKDANDSENVPIAHKKVIEPINDLTQTAPNLTELLAKEDQKEAISPVMQQEPSLPAQAVVQPAPSANSAVDTENSTEQHKPGNVITPGGGTISMPTAGSEQPSDIAL